MAVLGSDNKGPLDFQGCLTSMGLDGGTYITRSDVLRGQSWELATADNSRSTRGGNASTSAAKTRNVIDPRTAKYVYIGFIPPDVHCS